MKKIFSIEWPDSYGYEWLCLDNLKSCLFSKAHMNPSDRNIEVKYEIKSHKENKCTKVTSYKCDTDDQTKCRYYEESRAKTWESVIPPPCFYGFSYNNCTNQEAIENSTLYGEL